MDIRTGSSILTVITQVPTKQVKMKKKNITTYKNHVSSFGHRIIQQPHIHHGIHHAFLSHRFPRLSSSILQSTPYTLFLDLWFYISGIVCFKRDTYPTDRKILYPEISGMAAFQTFLKHLTFYLYKRHFLVLIQCIYFCPYYLFHISYILPDTRVDLFKEISTEHLWMSQAALNY